MESELKELSPNGSAAAAAAAVKDDQPLLKSESSASESGGAASHTTCHSPESLIEMEKKYAAYVRGDSYGTMGRGELPLREKALLALALVTLVPIRVVAGVLILVIYYLICRVCTLFKAPNRGDEQEDYAHMVGWRREAVVRCGRFLARAMLFTLGFYWISEARRGISAEDERTTQSEEAERPGVIVSNHVSYLDALLQFLHNMTLAFLLKRSVARLPLVGLISKCLGCVYVQRESKSSEFKGVSGIVTERIIEAHQNQLSPMMMLFPDNRPEGANCSTVGKAISETMKSLNTGKGELTKPFTDRTVDQIEKMISDLEGTTTNGDYLLPFKTGAFLAKVPVLPVILRYPYSRFSPAWDTISGMRHVFLLLCQFVNHMDVVRLPVYYPSEQEKEDPKLYANNVRKLMAIEGNLILTDIGLAEKRVYHAALDGNSLPRALHQKDD